MVHLLPIPNYSAGYMYPFRVPSALEPPRWYGLCSHFQSSPLWNRQDGRVLCSHLDSFTPWLLDMEPSPTVQGSPFVAKHFIPNNVPKPKPLQGSILHP